MSCAPRSGEGAPEESLSLRAVIFDYGMVLTGKPDAEAHDAMVRMTGLTPERFEQFYWADRHAYDEGKLNGITFWQKFARDAGLELSQSAIGDLNALDARMWTTCDPRMIAWQAELKRHGLLTAILSNMGDAVRLSIEGKFDWIRNFDVLVWSYELGIAKPDPAIYRHTLEQLRIAPEQALFIDDKRENVEAARSLEIRGIVFSTVEDLRAQLEDCGLDGKMPLPQSV